MEVVAAVAVAAVAVVVVVAVAAGVAAIRPSIGALLGYGALVVALGAHGDWVLALFTAAATGGWWYLIGRRGTTQAVSALVQPLLGAFGFAGVSPVLSGVLLPVLHAAISAAFAFLMALVMGSFGSLDLLNWDAVLHMELSGNPQAACMASARFDTRRRPSSNERAPLTTRAENSPSECPAVISGLKSGSDLARITEWRKTAGWVTLVCFSSSAVPLNMMSVMRNPSISLAFSNSSLAAGTVS